MPDVTRYATDPEMVAWLKDATENQTNVDQITAQGYKSIVQQPLALHFGSGWSGRGQENEKEPTQQQRKDFETAVLSALSSSIPKVSAHQPPVKIGILMPVNHKLDQRKSGFFSKIYDSQHWTGLAFDTTLGDKELEAFTSLKKNERALWAHEQALTLLKKLDNGKDPLERISTAQFPEDMLAVVAKFQPDLKELVELVTRRNKMKEDIKARLDRGEGGGDPNPQLSNLEDQIEKTIAQKKKEGLQLGEAIKNTELEKGKLKEGLSDAQSNLVKTMLNKSNITHYDSWENKDKRARYKGQIEGVLKHYDITGISSGNTEYQRATAATCGDHTAINLAKHIGCEYIFGKKMKNIDKPNNDIAIRGESDSFLATQKLPPPEKESLARRVLSWIISKVGSYLDLREERKINATISPQKTTGEVAISSADSEWDVATRERAKSVYSTLESLAASQKDPGSAETASYNPGYNAEKQPLLSEHINSDSDVEAEMSPPIQDTTSTISKGP